MAPRAAAASKQQVPVEHQAGDERSDAVVDADEQDEPRQGVVRKFVGVSAVAIGRVVGTGVGERSVGSAPRRR